VKIALAGDTMLGRKVGEVLGQRAPGELVDEAVVAITGEADLFLLNLECCISERGQPWPDPGRDYFFRAPPAAAELLAEIGVGCVTLANNHALDYGSVALLDTFEHLKAHDIRVVGAGPDVDAARRPEVFEHDGLRLAALGLCDHPATFAATNDRPGVAYADLRDGTLPEWVPDTLADVRARGADAVLVTPHWGPHMTTAPVPHVRAAAAALRQAGASLVAGHSAHLTHGVAGTVVYDMGDFLNDYATDIARRNDLSLLFLVELDATGPVELQAVPLHIGYRRTRLATGRDASWMRRRFRAACAALGTDVAERDGRLVVDWRG
jgi:poly-gamma-glutamate capsule biosynthesis protein CapA/YwtB (metallophosphatase superfamily)